MTHPWMPVSPCGPGCVATPHPTVGRITRYGRLVRAIMVLLFAMLGAPLLLVMTSSLRQRFVRRIFRRMLDAFGTRIELHGDTNFGRDLRAESADESDAGSYDLRGGLVVNNHVSWLDIVAVNAVRPMRALGKKEIADWPFIGMLAKRAGTIFLDRERLSALPAAVAQVADALRSGSLVSVTPEATTWCGLASGNFRPAFFQAAIDGGVPVLPIAIRYRLEDGTSTSWPAFIGDETLVESLMRVAKLRGLVVEVHVLDEIAPGRAGDRDELARLTQHAMAPVLDPALPEPARSPHMTSLR